jgi:hypothetical protein
MRYLVVYHGPSWSNTIFYVYFFTLLKYNAAVVEGIWLAIQYFVMVK